jgi:hypothetical protein
METFRCRSLALGALALTAGLFVNCVAAQQAPTVRAVRSEFVKGGVERPDGQQPTRVLQLMPPGTYEYNNGVYRSQLNRIALRVPRIGTELLVDVREALAMRRPDGSPATTHLMFDPGGTQIPWSPEAAASALVVTRLRDDRPKDVESILNRLDGGEAQWARLAERGVSYARIQTRMGPALQRVVRNRANSARFPYDLALLNDREATTYGVTDFVVVGTDSLIEFSQLVPCAGRSDADCRSAALMAMAALVDGVTDFKTYPQAAEAATAR